MVVIGSSHRRRAKSPLGTVLIINLLGKGLTPRACMGDGGSIWWAPDIKSVDGFVFFRLGYFDYSNLQFFAIFIFTVDFSETYLMSAENSISEYFLGEDTPRPPSCFRHCDAPPWAKNLATALKICLSSLSLSTPYRCLYLLCYLLLMFWADILILHLVWWQLLPGAHSHCLNFVG